MPLKRCVWATGRLKNSLLKATCYRRLSLKALRGRTALPPRGRAWSQYPLADVIKSFWVIDALIPLDRVCGCQISGRQNQQSCQNGEILDKVLRLTLGVNAFV